MDLASAQVNTDNRKEPGKESWLRGGEAHLDRKYRGVTRMWDL